MTWFSWCLRHEKGRVVPARKVACRVLYAFFEMNKVNGVYRESKDMRSVGYLVDVFYRVGSKFGHVCVRGVMSGLEEVGYQRTISATLTPKYMFL